LLPLYFRFEQRKAAEIPREEQPSGPLVGSPEHSIYPSWVGSRAQVEGLEFKPQYHKRKTKIKP
jgi:hypothetical protein